jgi:DNA-binding Xre family transcriptional regulator
MVRWRLRELLDKEKVSAYALAQQADVSANTVYAIARGTPKQVHLETLDAILEALSKLTGKSVTLLDVLEHVPNSSVGTSRTG